MKNFYFIFAAIAVIMMFVGCPDNANSSGNTEPTNTTNEDKQTAEFGMIIQLPGKSRAITYYSEDEVVRYVITVMLNNKTVATENGLPGESVRIRVTEEGTYMVAVSAYNEEDTLIGDGSGQKTIVSEDGFVSVTIKVVAKVKSIGTDLGIDIIWSIPLHNIIYQNLLDGTTDSLTTYYEKQSVTLKDAERDGFNFLGWYDNESCEGNAITGWGAGDRSTDVPLWAKWGDYLEGYGEGYKQNTDDTVISIASQVDFTNYANDVFSIKVRNNTMKKLIAFRGTPREENLISGIPAGASNWGLKRNPALFSNSADFVLVFVTEEDYLANKNDLNTLDNAPFTKLYAYYNANSNNNMVYEISICMGGNGSIVLNNGNSPYNIELRKDGINGETMGYFPAYTVNTTFKIDYGMYYIFPVFRKFNAILNGIITVYPKKATGKAICEIFEIDEDVSSISLNSNNWIQNATLSHSATYIKINNNSANGICLYSNSNSNPYNSLNGSQMINAGQSVVFPIYMDLVSGSAAENPEYAEYIESAQYCVGNAVTDKVYLTSGTSSIGDSFKFYAGKLYEVDIFESGHDFNIDLSWMDASSDVEF